MTEEAGMDRLPLLCFRVSFRGHPLHNKYDKHLLGVCYCE